MANLKIIQTYYANGYSLANNTNLYITSTGSVASVFAGYAATITNEGRVNGGNFYGGVEFTAGGSLINGSFSNPYALVEGRYGAQFLGVGTVTNYGTIKGVANLIYGSDAGVGLYDGGSLTNGSTSDRYALVEGAQGILIRGASGSVANFGTVLGLEPGSHAAVQLQAGGTVSNGSAGDERARIAGGVGVVLGGAGDVFNFGVIIGSASQGAGQGVVLYAGGDVVDGSPSDSAAFIGGVEQGVGLVLGGTVINYGAIAGYGVANYDTGVRLNNGGRLVNGANTDLAASISGYAGAVLNGAGTVLNYGLIRGTGVSSFYGSGVALTAGGTVYNGAPTDRTALIEGARGVYVASAPGTIRNAGTIVATGLGAGVALAAGGLVVNGSLNNPGALIKGYDGLALYGGSATNFGVVSGLGDSTSGVYEEGANITNGAAGHAGALIEGYVGVNVIGASATTVTNFGTIAGAGGTAVMSSSPAFTLAVEAKCAFRGAVLGGGGTLDLASGVGTISGLQSSLAAIAVSGSMAATTFQNFGTLEVGAGATFTDKGAVTLAAGQAVDAAGVLNISGAVKNGGALSVAGGTLTVGGAVTGAGVATIAGGTLDLKSSFAQNVTFSGTSGVLQLAQSQTYTGAIAGFSKTGGTSLDLVDIAFTGSSEATYAGGKNGGTLTVTDGTHTAHITFKGNYLSSTFVASSDGHGGTIVIDPKARVPLPPIGPASPSLFIAAMAGLGVSPAGSVHTAEAWAVHDLTLAKPRAAIA